MQLLNILILLLGHLWSPTDADADKIKGYWMSPQKDLIVKCYKGTDGKYHGTLAWFKVYKSDHSPKSCDIPQTEWVGKTVLSQFTYSKKEWSGGRIIDIKKCNNYDAYIQMQADGTLKATGFIVFRWLSESITFTKYNGLLPDQE